MSEYVAGKFYVGEVTNNIHAVEKALTDRFLTVDGYSITDDAEKKEWIDKIEAISEGRNTVMFDAKDLPSIMYRMPVRTQDQLVGNGVNNVFESWIVDNALIKELYVAKYLASNVTVDNALYPVSLYGLDPANSINFDNSLAACQRKGTGFNLNTNANWMQLVHESYHKGAFQAHGNTNYCRYYGNTAETAEASYLYNNQAGRSKTGTGPNTWYHDGTPFGVADMVGDVWEWCSGLKTASGGEILVLPNNDAMNPDNSQAATSDKYKGIAAADGSYTEPGTEGNLFYKVDGTTPILTDSTQGTASDAFHNVYFKDLAASGITVPNIAYRLGLMPFSGGNQAGRLYHNGSQEDLCNRGGHFVSTTDAGAFALDLDHTRAISYFHYGFRFAFYRK